MKPKLYEAKDYVDEALGYTLRVNYGSARDWVLHYHNYYEFFLTITDGIVHYVNGETQHLPKQSLVLVRMSDAHDYLSGGGQSFLNLTFTDEVMREMCSYFGERAEALISAPMPPITVLDDSEYARVSEMLDMLNTSDISDLQARQIRAKFLLIELMFCMLNNKTEHNDASLPRWLSELADYLKRPENFALTLEDMSKRCQKSLEHISRSFKKYFGVTASDYMNEQKLVYSANLLLSTNLPIVDVCYESGFGNMSYFYRRFKEKFGTTPQAFRKRVVRV